MTQFRQPEPYPHDLDAPPEGERWSSWEVATHGPAPRPDWVITALGAVDADLGLLKTGKEADVHVVRRWLPGFPDADVLMAAKRFRTAQHRMFHRDAGYLEGRRVRRSRETRAMATRTAFGKELIGARWAAAEFETLSMLWAQQLPVPYPVSLHGHELLLQLVGHDGEAAPRLAQARPDRSVLPMLFEQLREAMEHLARLGWAHGDLSAYNVLLEGERVVIIDWPQVIDVIGNPHGFEYLERDARNVAQWFTRRGYAVDGGELFADLVAAATARW
ncbi:MAG: serine protein kinase RIO [Dermatophilaceae bacterium]